MAIDSPGARGCARARPALISGKVMPSSTDCGRISRHDTPSFPARTSASRSEEHTSELQPRLHLVCRLLLEKKNIDPGPAGPYRGLRDRLSDGGGQRSPLRPF